MTLIKDIFMAFLQLKMCSATIKMYSACGGRRKNINMVEDDGSKKGEGRVNKYKGGTTPHDTL